MTIEQLREEFEAFTEKYKKHSYDGEVEQTVDAIMSKVAEHTKFVIGEDGQYKNNTEPDTVTVINTENQLRAEQRKRAGLEYEVIHKGA